MAALQGYAHIGQTARRRSIVSASPAFMEPELAFESIDDQCAQSPPGLED